MKLQDLTGFNNTGNICVWPSEEVLGGFCLENLQLFDKKSVLELGAGMSGLAGLMVAQACSPTEVVISDGNQNSVENLEFVVNQNLSEKRINNVSVQVMRHPPWVMMVRKYLRISYCSWSDGLMESVISLGTLTS